MLDRFGTIRYPKMVTTKIVFSKLIVPEAGDDEEIKVPTDIVPCHRYSAVQETMGSIK